MKQLKETWQETWQRLYEKEQGAWGYILLWIMGVPVSVLFLIFVLRGCR